MAVQQKASANKLSERNVVDIVQKLVEKYNLGLIYTLSGKEYLTPYRLVQDIKKEVVNEGRISLLDLPSSLNVSIEQIEAHAPQVVNKDIYLVNGQLLSAFYLENLCQEINLSLQEIGQIALGELTVKYALPMNFLKDEIQKRLGGTISAQFSKNNTLVTDAYLVRHLGKLRGALRAAVKPFDLKGFDQSLVVSQVKSLISSEELKGVLDGMNFIPNVYQNTIWEEIRSYYFVNKYVEYDYIRRRLVHIGEGDYKKVCEKLGYGENMGECYVHSELISEIKRKVQETMEQKPFIDFYDIELPGCVSEEDLDGLLSEGVYATGHYLYTNRSLDQAVTALNPLLSAFTEESKGPTKGKKKDTLSIETIQSELKKKKFLNAPPEFLEGFSDAVYSRVARKITETRENRAKPAALVPDTLLSDFNYLYLCNKSLGVIHKQYPNIGPFQAHLSRGLGRDLFMDLLKVELLHHGVQVASTNFNEREKLISKLPDYLKEIFNKLSQKLSSKDIDGFIVELLANIKDIPVVSLRAVDKKTERAVMHKIKSESKARAKLSLDQRKYVEAGIMGLRLKLMENGVLLEVPNEKWGISALLEVCTVLLVHDICFDFLRLAADDAENARLAELLEEFSSLLSLTS